MNTTSLVHLVPSLLVWGQNQVHCACETAQAAHRLILKSRQQGLRAYCPYVPIRSGGPEQCRSLLSLSFDARTWTLNGSSCEAREKKKKKMESISMRNSFPFIYHFFDWINKIKNAKSSTRCIEACHHHSRSHGDGVRTTTKKLYQKLFQNPFLGCPWSVWVGQKNLNCHRILWRKKQFKLLIIVIM